MLADLHIHSTYSDGTWTPEEIVARAQARGVEIISVTDHNGAQGTLLAKDCARAANLPYICGAEIDAFFAGYDIHILAYGADFSDARLTETMRFARARLDGMSDTLLKRMGNDYPALSEAGFRDFVYDPARGGWKFLQYLMAQGVIHTAPEGFRLYERYDVTYAAAGFAPAAEVVAAIHGAGGLAVLAHPGVVFPVGRIGEFCRAVEEALDLGLDGAECRYPRHSAGITRALNEICARRGLWASAGSDSHGAFNSREISGAPCEIPDRLI